MRTLLLFCLFLLLPHTLLADGDLKRRLELSQDIVILRDTGGLIKKLIDKRKDYYRTAHTLMQLKITRRNPNLKGKVASALAQRYVQLLREEERNSAPDIEKRMTTIYAEEYTQSELRQMKQFFSSTAGRKFFLLNSAHLEKAIAGAFQQARTRANERFLELQQQLKEKSNPNPRPNKEYEM
ncbi:hypothetical protein Mmc1_3041 [Magnetococcus marinus MC-1]|uniref:DUF2059 domain-containing protein n=1 Tax=Magnetococcus marinus (strain ATCC BAA-1437 / JCM 17883 / MC-1) TaxID=156889 RepID=A0LC39_MAGMM|nr:DUF2059 domain-containing protein [Magnetococcus marinus]ABK45532.1 hypothetical protein Mmc1_3041 [Magnetococcus marinus MC-1]